jgi:hypothetical protein
MRHIASCLGAFLVVACSTAPNEGLDAKVTLDRSRLVPGETVTITVTVSGGILQGSSTCLTGYNVLDTTGAVVAPGDVICTADMITRSLYGGPYVRQFSWAGYTGTGTTGTPLLPGTYQIVGGAGASGNLHSSVSAPVSLEVLE